MIVINLITSVSQVLCHLEFLGCGFMHMLHLLSLFPSRQVLNGDALDFPTMVKNFFVCNSFYLACFCWLQWGLLCKLVGVKVQILYQHTAQN